MILNFDTHNSMRLVPGMVIKCEAFRGGPLVYLLLKRVQGTRSYDVFWNCLLLDSGNETMMAGSLYSPDEDFLRQGELLS